MHYVNQNFLRFESSLKRAWGKLSRKKVFPTYILLYYIIYITLLFRITLVEMNNVEVFGHIETVRAAITVDFVATVVHSKAD